MVQFNELKITPNGLNMIIDASILPDKYYKDVYISEVLIDTQDTYLVSGPSSNLCYHKNFTELYTSYKFGDIYVNKDDFYILYNNEEVLDNDYIEEGEYEITQIVGIRSNSKIAILDNLKYDGVNLYDDLQVSFINKDVGNNIKVGDKFIVEKGTASAKKTINLTISSSDILASLTDNMFFVYIKTVGTPTPDTPCGMDNVTTLGVVINLYPLYQQAFGYIKELSDTCIIPKNFINFILQYKMFQLAIKTGHYTEAIKYWKKFHFSQGIKDVTVTNKCGCYG